MDAAVTTSASRGAATKEAAVEGDDGILVVHPEN